MRSAIALASLTAVASIYSASAVVLFQDNFETATATPFTISQQLANPGLQTDNDPNNTVYAADAVVPGKWFHYYKASTPVYGVQVTSNVDTPPFGPAVTGSYEGSNVLRLNRRKEPPSSSTAIAAGFDNQTSGIVRASWKQMVPHQQFGLEFGITFPAMWGFTPYTDNDHQDGLNGAQTPVAFVHGLNGSGDFEGHLRSLVGGYPFSGGGGSIEFAAGNPKVETNKWQQYVLEANIDTQTYKMTVDGMSTPDIPFSFAGGFDALVFRVGQAAAPGDPTITAMYFIDDLLIEKVSPKWKVDASGNWTDANNWDGAVPNAAGAVAEFGSAIQAARTVTVDAPITVGQIFFNNANAYTVGGSSTLTLQGAGTAAANITVSAGSHSITAPVVLASDASTAGTGTLTLGNVTNNGTLTIGSRLIAGNIDGSGNVAVAPGQKLDVQRVRQGTVTVNGTLTISGARSSAKTSVVTNMAIDSLGHVDLGQNDLIVSSTGTSSVSTIRGQITSGYANGSWNGVGLSSSAAGNTVNGVRALGYADNGQLGLTTFNGISVDSTKVLVRYTAAGDADLSGTVDSLDFTRFIAGYGTTSDAYWMQGDFNYDRKVNTLDFNLLAGSFGQTVPTPSVALGSVVPEPACAAVLAVIPMMLRRRR